MLILYSTFFFPVSLARDETFLAAAVVRTIVEGVLYVYGCVSNYGLLEVARTYLLLGPGFGAAWLAAWPIAARLQVTN